MMYSKDFFKSTNILLLVGLALGVLTILLKINGFSAYDVPEGIMIRNAIVFRLLSVVRDLAFWMLVSIVVKDKKSALIAFGISALATVVSALIAIARHDIDHGSFILWLPALINLASFLVFGWLHFKHAKGLFVALAFLLSWGTGLAFGSNYFSETLSLLFRELDLEDLFMIKYNMEGNSYSMINVAPELLVELNNVLLFIIFTSIYNIVKTGRLSMLLEIPRSTHLTHLNFSVFFWVLRITLYGMAFSFIAQLMNYYRVDLLTNFYIRMIPFMPAVVLVALLYRNLLTSYSVKRGYYPGLLYLLLSVPVLNIIFWVIYMYAHRNQGQTSDTPVWDRLQKQFINNNSNVVIKGLFLLILLATLIDRSLGLFGNASSETNLYVSFMLGLISFMLVVWYMTDHRVMKYLVLIYTLAIPIVIMLELEAGVESLSVAGLINLIIYYPLFHFNELKAVQSENDEDPVQDEESIQKVDEN